MCDGNVTLSDCYFAFAKKTNCRQKIGKVYLFYTELFCFIVIELLMHFRE